jgi:hypothetical protein
MDQAKYQPYGPQVMSATANHAHFHHTMQASTQSGQKYPNLSSVTTLNNLLEARRPAMRQ